MTGKEFHVDGPTIAELQGLQCAFLVAGTAWGPIYKTSRPKIIIRLIASQSFISSPLVILYDLSYSYYNCALTWSYDKNLQLTSHLLSITTL